MKYDKEAACKLRREGKSYGEICKTLGIRSKGTLSAWFHNLKLTSAAKMRLQKKTELARKRGLLKFNADRTKRVQGENHDAMEIGADLVGRLNERERMVIAAALYWGEGTKSQGDGRSIMAVLTNSDPDMIRFHLRFLREILRIPEGKIRAQVLLHDHASSSRTKSYWQKITGIDPSAISLTVRVSTASKRKRPARSLPYGTIQIRVHDRKLYFKLMGMIYALKDQTKEILKSEIRSGVGNSFG